MAATGLIDLGDTTDDRTSIPVPTINSLLSGLTPFRGWNVKLIGNHEQFLRNATVNVGKLFERHFAVIDDFASWRMTSPTTSTSSRPTPAIMRS
jgi:hypothetical protein